MPPGVWLTPNLRNVYVGVRSDSGVRPPDVHLVPTYTFRVDAVGKEAALALLHVCVFDLQWRGSQTHLYRQLFESVTLDALRNRDLEGRNNIR